jgi:hypothetical protein
MCNSLGTARFESPFIHGVGFGFQQVGPRYFVGLSRMKTKSTHNAQVAARSEVQSKRRQLVVGAGVAAGAAAAAAALGQRVAGPVAAAKSVPGATEGEGYRLTDHVLRYYETTRS